MGISHQAFNVISRDGTFLQGRYWKPEKSPIATICIIHGLGEYSMKYDAWARRLCAENYMIYAIDYRGHGQSDGKRGHIDNINDFLNDIGALFRRCKSNFENIPCFIYGHSMGGNLALNFLMKRQQDFAGAIITSPWIQLSKPPSLLRQRLLHWLNPVFPETTFNSGVKSGHMSSKSPENNKKKKDPLEHKRISIRLFNEIEKGAKNILAWKTAVEIPLLLLHGADDPLTKPEGTKLIADKNPELFTIINYPETLHEIHNEPASDKAFNDITQWLSNQISKL